MSRRDNYYGRNHGDYDRDRERDDDRRKRPRKSDYEEGKIGKCQFENISVSTPQDQVRGYSRDNEGVGERRGGYDDKSGGRGNQSGYSSYSGDKYGGYHGERSVGYGGSDRPQGGYGSEKSGSYGGGDYTASSYGGHGRVGFGGGRNTGEVALYDSSGMSRKEATEKAGREERKRQEEEEREREERAYNLELEKIKLEQIKAAAVFSISNKEKVEILIKEDGKFLDLRDVPPKLKLRSGLGDYMYIRDCYDILMDDIIRCLPRKRCKCIAVLGTEGIGKSSLFFFVLKMLFDDPTKFGLNTRSFYFQTIPDVASFYHHEGGTSFTVCSVHSYELDAAIPLFADMENEHESPKEHVGMSLIFTSFRRAHYRELTKNGWRKVMPTWSAEEQADFFNSNQFRNEHSEEIAQRAYDYIKFFGGSIRNNIQAAIETTIYPTEMSPMNLLEAAIDAKGGAVCENFFKSGFSGSVELMSDVLVHQNPRKVEDVYYFNEPGAFSFASPYILRRLLSLNNNMLVTEARNKYNVGTFRGGINNGNEFELLCLHGFMISGVEFQAQPLTEGVQSMQVKFPPKQVLARNWREQEHYLKADVLYIPPCGNLESGDSFCLIDINGRSTLVILQCTISESHPVKENGVKVIHDCFKKNLALEIDDIVIMFMIPVNGKLKTEQPLVTSKDGEVQRATIKVTAQYKIENHLVTVDENNDKI